MGTVVTSVKDLPQYAAQSQASTGSNALGKDAFLKLLTTQLQQQDPLNPQDSSAFVAQLAQFSSLEQLNNLGSKLDTLAVAQAANNQMNATGLVGKDVRFAADKIGLVEGQASQFQVTLGGAADNTVATIMNASGAVVAHVQLGPRSAGTFTASWNGQDDNGNALPPGEYVFSVAGTTKDGKDVGTTATVRGTVSGVSFESGTAQLLVAGRHIPLSDVIEILSTTPSGA